MGQIPGLFSAIYQSCNAEESCIETSAPFLANPYQSQLISRLSPSKKKWLLVYLVGLNFQWNSSLALLHASTLALMFFIFELYATPGEVLFLCHQSLLHCQLKYTFLLIIPPSLLLPLSQTTVYRIGQGFETHSNNKSRFIKVEETKQVNKFRVLNPFSQHPIKNMPASFPKELNHLNFRVVETERAFSIRQIRDDADADSNEDNPWIRKINLASNFDSSFVVVAIERGDLCRMRVDSDIQWCLLDSDVQYRDITNFQGKFFTVDLYGVILGLDENSFSLDEIHSPLEQKVWEGERYFLESCGHLYVVVRDFYTFPGQVYYNRRIDGFIKETGVENVHVPVKFKVYKRIPSDHQQNRYEWVEVNDLGDRVFFVSTDCSFSFST